MNVQPIAAIGSSVKRTRTVSMGIGELAAATETKVVTVRYYEKIGLLAPAPRSPANYRSYSEDDLRRLRFIRRCRNLGFTLDQIRELLRLSSNSQHKCSEVDRITAEHLSKIEAKISDLQQLAVQLRHIGARCKGRGRIGNCRIIEVLSS